MIVRGAFNHMLRPGLRRDFRDSYQQYPEEYGTFLKVGGLDRAEEERVALSGLGRQVRRGEVMPITYVDPTESDKYIYVDEEFALGFQISLRMVEDDQYGRMKQNAQWLGRAARLTQEYNAAAMLDDAFDGNIFTGLFDEALISDSHSLLNGSGTWSNRIAGNTALSVTGMQQAQELGEAQVDHQGDPMPMMADRLLVDRTDEQVAIQLTGNNEEPFTANRNINSMKKKRDFTYKLLHYKTADGSWFYQDMRNIDAHFLFRVRPQTGDSQDEGGTLAMRFWNRQRFLVYFFDQRGWIGSDGSGS